MISNLDLHMPAAANVGFKVFISFDSRIGRLQHDGDLHADLCDETRTVLNTTTLPSYPVSWVMATRIERSKAKVVVTLFACPNWQPGSFVSNSNADCGFAWNAAWPNTNNQPLDANITTTLDQQYISDLGSKAYMMRTFPFRPGSLHITEQTTYSKNWIFYSDWLYQSRWDEVLQVQPQFVEIVTWNDFGESHYIGPLHGNNSPIYAGGPTGAERWVNGMPHDAWRDVAQVYISAFKSGASTPTVTTDELVYYYRPNPKGTTCSDTVAPQPTGYQYDDDFVFVIALLKSAGTVTITSGSKRSEAIFPLPLVSILSRYLWALGRRTSLSRALQQASMETEGLQITNQCSVYNFNAYVGKVTA
ncbi:glycoside hydrolase family 71 protein [Mycena olivaceomarginata]|nr:glycoside hydrolase family 71 protein [Mycena olivaceomarginata]